MQLNGVWGAVVGRNSLTKFQGKSLAQWQEDIRVYCKDAGKRRCLQNDSLETLRYKSEMNFRCLMARSAVQYFYDEIDPEHLKQIKNARKSVDDCYRFTLQAYRREQNNIKKMFNLYQKHQDDLRHAEKAKGKTKSKPALEAQKLASEFSSDVLQKSVSKKTGLVSEKDLKSGLKVIEKLNKEVSVFDVKKIKFRKK